MANSKYYTTNMQSNEYWAQRANDLDKVIKKAEKQTMKKIVEEFKKAYRNIEKDINDFIVRYAENNKISYDEATKILSPIDVVEYSKKMDELRALYAQTGDKYIFEQIKILESRLQITRMQALIDAIDVELSKFAYQMQLNIFELAEGLYTRAYKDAVEMLGGLPIEIPIEAIKAVLNYPFAGVQFADSVWYGVKGKLIDFLKKELAQSLIKGESVDKIAKKLMDATNVLLWQSERLVRTEVNFAYNQGHLKAYQEMGVKEYQYLAHIDDRTSTVCRKLDEKVYKLENALVGKNYPPMHPNCRSTVIPVVKNPIKKNNEESN